jgi:hypothetical protein
MSNIREKLKRKLSMHDKNGKLAMPRLVAQASHCIVSQY